MLQKAYSYINRIIVLDIHYTACFTVPKNVTVEHALQSNENWQIFESTENNIKCQNPLGKPRTDCLDRPGEGRNTNDSKTRVGRKYKKPAYERI